MRTHFAIRDAIGSAGGKLESPKRTFADDPEDDILEVIEAAFASEHRRKNAEQTRDRMRARCLNGYWCLQLPAGYKYHKVKGQGALIERNEPAATIIQSALEAYACGHLETQAEVARFLNEHPEYPRGKSGRVSDQKASDMLTNPLYAGYVHVPAWDVSLRPSHHPALIDFATFQKIQNRLKTPVRTVRNDNSADFPLRAMSNALAAESRSRAAGPKARSSGTHITIASIATAKPMGGQSAATRSKASSRRCCKPCARRATCSR